MRSLLIDNDPETRAQLSRLLTRETLISRVDECGDCLAAAQLVARGGIDLALVRVGIEEMSGVEQLLRIPRSRLPRIAFLFENREKSPDQLQTPEGVEVPILHRDSILADLVDLLGRSRSEDAEEAGAQTFDQLRFIVEHCGGADSNNNGGGRTLHPFLQRILIRNGNDSRLIPANAIDWVESADHYVYLHSSGRAHLLYATMNGLEDQLQPGRFIRAHRGAIVNLHSIEKVSNGKFGTLVLTLVDGTEVRVSRSRREDVRKSLE